ncbi:MAG: response regulator [Rhodospirillales bacterium]|nr:response regulator [Rhodospirillales bacterium]
MTDYNLERLNFLVVDDNKHMRNLVKSILGALGVRTIMEAADGADALKELRHCAADIIILDWNMDPLDGLDLTRMIRQPNDSANPFVPIIMLTGHTEMKRVIEARDSGINEFLAKPVSAKRLYERIKSVIEKPRSFIEVKGMTAYFGPDRRRRPMPGYKGPERRKDEKGAVSDGPQEGDGGKMSQDDLDSMFDS